MADGGARIVVWFSCGTPSAIAARLTLARAGASDEVVVARCVVPEEHADNERFTNDIERWLGVPIIRLQSEEYESCQDVWTRTRYMSGVHGARCTVEMKKAVRWAFEGEWRPDYQVFGYFADEADRAALFRKQNPEVPLVTPLIDAGLSRQDCHAMVVRAGIELPMMYRLGYNNNNCIGCVKAQSPAYWNRVRRTHPEAYEARATLSREIGCRLVKGTSGERERIFLDELGPDDGLNDPEPAIDCSLLCYIAEQVDG